MIGFAAITNHTFTSYTCSFWADVLLKLWFPWYWIICSLVLYHAQRANWWFLIWLPEIVRIPHGPGFFVFFCKFNDIVHKHKDEGQFGPYAISPKSWICYSSQLFCKLRKSAPMLTNYANISHKLYPSGAWGWGLIWPICNFIWEHSMLQLSCKPDQLSLNPYWVMVSMGSFGTNYTLMSTQIGQCGPFAISS